jgi:hypothetical protein
VRVAAFGGGDAFSPARNPELLERVRDEPLRKHFSFWFRWLPLFRQSVYFQRPGERQDYPASGLGRRK